MALFRLSVLCLFLVVVPMLDPHKEALVRIVHEAMDLPVEILEPLEFHAVQFMNRNVGDLGPGSVLECIVIEKLATEQKACRQHLHETSR